MEAYSQRVRPRVVSALPSQQAGHCDPTSSTYGSQEEIPIPDLPFVTPAMLQYSTIIGLPSELPTEPDPVHLCESETTSLSDYPYTYCAKAEGDLATSCTDTEAVDCRASSCSDTGQLLADTLEQVGAFYFEWTGRVGWDDDVDSEHHRIRALTDFGKDLDSKCDPTESADCTAPVKRCCDTDMATFCCDDPRTVCTIPQAFASSSDGNTSPARWFDQGRMIVISSRLLKDAAGEFIGTTSPDETVEGVFIPGVFTPDDDAFQGTLAHELCHGIEFAEAQSIDIELMEKSHRWVHEAVADVMAVMRQAYERRAAVNIHPDWYLGLKCGASAGEDGPDCPCGFTDTESFGVAGISQFSDPIGGTGAQQAGVPFHLTQIARTGDLADNSRLLTKLAQLLGDPLQPSAAQLHHGIQVPNIDSVPWGYKDLTQLFLDTLIAGQGLTLTDFREDLIEQAAKLTSIDPKTTDDGLPICSQKSTCGAGPDCDGTPTCVLAPTCVTEQEACDGKPDCEGDPPPAFATPDCPTPEALAASAQIVSMVRAAADSVGLWTAENHIGDASDAAWIPATSEVTTARLGSRRYMFWISAQGALAYKTRECSFDAEATESCPPAEDHPPLAGNVASFAVVARQKDEVLGIPAQLFFLFAKGTPGSLADMTLCWFDEFGAIEEAPYPLVSSGIDAISGDGLAMAIQDGFLYLFYREFQSTPAGLVQVAALDLANSPWSVFPPPAEYDWEVIADTPDIYATTGISAAAVPDDISDPALAERISVAFGSELGTATPPSNPYSPSALTIWNFKPTSPSTEDLSHWLARSYDSTACFAPEIEGRPFIAWFRGYLHFAAKTDILRSLKPGEKLVDAQGVPLGPQAVAAQLQDRGIVYGRSRDPLDPVFDCPEAGATFAHWATPWTLETGKTDRPSMLDVEPEVPGEQNARLMLWSIPEAAGAVMPTLRSKASD